MVGSCRLFIHLQFARAAFPACLSPFPSSPIALKHRERQRGCALRHSGLLLHWRA
jgi:hypothetical protein